jgi:hypothetical protein
VIRKGECVGTCGPEKYQMCGQQGIKENTKKVKEVQR